MYAPSAGTTEANWPSKRTWSPKSLRLFRLSLKVRPSARKGALLYFSSLAYGCSPSPGRPSGRRWAVVAPFVIPQLFYSSSTVRLCAIVKMRLHCRVRAVEGAGLDWGMGVYACSSSSAMRSCSRAWVMRTRWKVPVARWRVAGMRTSSSISGLSYSVRAM